MIWIWCDCTYLSIQIKKIELEWERWGLYTELFLGIWTIGSCCSSNATTANQHEPIFEAADHQKHEPFAGCNPPLPRSQNWELACFTLSFQWWYCYSSRMVGVVVDFWFRSQFMRYNRELHCQKLELTPQTLKVSTQSSRNWQIFYGGKWDGPDYRSVFGTFLYWL